MVRALKKRERVFRSVKTICIAAVTAFLWLTGTCEKCYGSQCQDIIDEMDFDEADSASEVTGIDFKQLVEDIAKGEESGGDDLLSLATDTLLWQLKSNQKGFVHVFILAIISAVFTNFSSAFKNNTISDTGIFVSLLAIIALLFSCFYLSQGIADDAISGSITFMKGVLPVLSLAVAASGASVSALVINELILGLITLIYWLFQVVVLKIAGIYAAFSMVNSLSKDKSLGKLCKLFNLAGGWIVKTMIGLVVGIGAIQALIVPMSDSIKANVLTKALSFIPGIGNGVSAVSGTVLGAACLVKNSIGVAAFIVVLCICLVPVAKLAIFVIMYRVLAAVLEPVCDTRITTCINDVSSAIKIQLSAVAASAGLFMIAVAIICATTNVSYYAG